MTDTEILDQCETLVEPTPLSKFSQKIGFDFEEIIACDPVRCIRCGYQFEFSISMPSDDVGLFSEKRIKLPINQMEFEPYSCPHCGAKIVGISEELEADND